MGSALTSNPFVSIVVPLCRPHIPHLKRCVESVLKQTEPSWELILVDDGSNDSAVTAVFDRARQLDQRIRTIQRPTSTGPVDALNEAVAASTGDWLAVLEPSDMLARTALAFLNTAAAHWTEAVMLFSDHAVVDDDGHIVGSVAKPTWSPERLNGNMYISHLLLMKRDEVVAKGGFRPDFEGVHEHDLALRLAETGSPVLHLPHDLYLRRQSAAIDSHVQWPTERRERGVRACQEHFERVGLSVDVAEAQLPGYYAVRRHPRPGSLASIIIPTRGTPAKVHGRPAEPLVCNAVRSMLADAGRTPVEFVVVYDDDGDLAYIEELRRMAGDRLKLVRYDKPFNFSDKCNAGALAAAGDVLVFANDDLEIISAGWIDQLTALVQDDGVGCAGALLYFEDGTVQHGGHTIPPSSPHPRTPTHSYIGQDETVGSLGDLLIEHEVLGVTAALVACRAKVFDEIGGFSLEYPVNYNDVDFNLKILQAGYRIIFSPQVKSWHFESKTRDGSVKDEEVEKLHMRWHHRMLEDPYHRAG